MVAMCRPQDHCLARSLPPGRTTSHLDRGSGSASYVAPRGARGLDRFGQGRGAASHGKVAKVHDAALEPLLPQASLLEELHALLTENPRLAKLVEPHPDEPDRPVHRLLAAGRAPYYVVPVPVAGRPGTLYVSRLPGLHHDSTRAEVAALLDLGVNRIVCLVPTQTLNQVHHADRYLQEMATRFDGRFTQLEIVDHHVPRSDEAFEAALEAVDEDLRRGRTVLVHCVGGCGRTGMFVASLLVRAGLEAEEAIRAFRRQRRCGPETPEQVAYVVRYASRRATRKGGAGGSTADYPRVRVTVDRSGQPVQLARGGLARIQLGRLKLGPRHARRVAIKRFARDPTKAEAQRQQEVIEILVRAGVRLPRMAMMPLDGDGPWVQVTPLFGSTGRGAKLEQPRMFYRNLAPIDRRFAIDQLTRVAEAGFMPSLDLFLVFQRGGDGGIIPMDLDLIVPEVSTARRAAKVLSCIIQVGHRADERDALLDVAYSVAGRDLADGIRALIEPANSRYRAYWSF